MLVGKMVLSGGARASRFEDARLAFKAAAFGDSKRIAFTGKTSRGRSGIAIDVNLGRITGHKIDPIPEGLSQLVHHMPRSAVRRGLELAATGEDVLIGNPEHGIAIRWVGTGVEVFGAGDDSHS